MYSVKYAKICDKQKVFIKNSGLSNKVKDLEHIVELNPYKNPPKYEKLKGVKNRYSRRINRKHRFVYEVHEGTQIINVLSIWTHY